MFQITAATLVMLYLIFWYVFFYTIWIVFKFGFITTPTCQWRWGSLWKFGRLQFLHRPTPLCQPILAPGHHHHHEEECDQLQLWYWWWWQWYWWWWWLAMILIMMMMIMTRSEVRLLCISQCLVTLSVPEPDLHCAPVHFPGRMIMMMIMGIDYHHFDD